MRRKIFLDGGFILLFFSVGSTIGCAQWFEDIYSPYNYYSVIEYHGSDLFVGTAEYPESSHVYVSRDGGEWRAMQSLVLRQEVWDLAFTDSIIFEATYQGVRRSTNDGYSWEWLNTGSLHHSFQTVITVGHHANDSVLIFSAANSEGIFRSTDRGVTWLNLSAGIKQKAVQSFTSSDSVLLAGVPRIVGASNGCLYRTNNYGVSWTPSTTGMMDSAVNCLATSPFGVIAGTPAGPYLSTDHGYHWQLNGFSLGNDTILSLAVRGSVIFAGTRNGIYMSTDSCRNWQDINDGLPERKIVDHLACSSTMLYAQCWPSKGLWVRPISELVGVDPDPSLLPDGLSLEQNYPNPFNPVTTIGFTLREAGEVTIVVSDVAGHKVAIPMASRRMAMGRHVVRFNATGLPSGLYLYRIEVRDRSGTVERRSGKMTYLR